MLKAEAPDIETASEDYATRFSGELGRYLLEVQAQSVLSLLPRRNGPLRILEVGGGHLQLTPHLLEAGHEVWVHGSSPEALQRVSSFKGSNDLLHLATSSLYSLPFTDEFFDAVVSVRVLAHISHPKALLTEWTRVAKERIIFDYPPLESFNVLYPVLFKAKKLIEKNTRVFAIYKTHTLKEILDTLGWQLAGLNKQFFLPMGLHRALRRPSLSARLEKACRCCGLTSLGGSPGVLAAERRTKDE